MWSRLKQMMIKEFIQVFRDGRTRFLLFGPPIIQMMIFGYAANFEIRGVRVALVDSDRTPESRALLARFTATPYFTVLAQAEDTREVTTWLDEGRVMLVLHVREGFSRDLRTAREAPLQVLADSTNSNTALIALGYINQIAAVYAQDFQRDLLLRQSPALAVRAPRVTLEERPWYNPSLRSRWYFVPGVIGSLTTVIIVTLTSFAVVREREIGTLEQILVTPIRSFEFVLGKTLPFFLIGLADVALIATVGTFWFRIPFRGSLLIMFGGTVLYLLCVLGVGLFISTISSTQQQAMVSGFFFLMPAINFSGFGFPIRAMPELMQTLSYLDPLRYFLVVIRGVYIKGVGWDVLWPQFAAMAVFSVALLTLSVARFHKSLE